MEINGFNDGCTAHWANAQVVKSLFTARFDGCRCHIAYPDQLHTFVGDCSSDDLFVAMVPKGDVRFPSNKLKEENIVVVVSEQVSADYLEYLQDMNISYVVGGKTGNDMETVMNRLNKNFGIERLSIVEL